jgi:hypothetical protein
MNPWDNSMTCSFNFRDNHVLCSNDAMFGFMIHPQFSMLYRNNHPAGTSQRKGEVLVELEDPHQRDESAAAHQECHLGKGWMPEQDHQGDGGSLEVPSSCWSGQS